MRQLHPKIQALRKSVGSTPILRAHVVNKLVEPETVRYTKKDDGRTLKQYFAIWGIPDDYGTVPIKGCFSKSLQDRGPASKATYKIVALYMHNLCDSVGLPSVLVEDEIGLYGEVPALEGVQVADELVIRHNKGVCNNGSYGFNYVWDKMEYDDKTDKILVYETDLNEISFVTIGSQKETYGVRSSTGEYTDEFLSDETEDLIRLLPRKYHLELRSLIDRHITLAKLQPLEQRQKALEDGKPQQEDLYDYLLKNLNK